MFEYPGRYFEIIRQSFRSLDNEVNTLGGLLPDGGRLLDLGCGTGQILRELTQRGYRCVGVDRSHSFIEYGRTQVAGTDFAAKVELIESELADYEPPQDMRFDVIMSIWVTLNYLPHEQIRPLLARTHEWLAPGGALLLDVAHMLNFVEDYRPYIIAHHRDEAGEVLITRYIEHKIHPHRGIWAHDETLLIKDGDRLHMFHDHYDQVVLSVPELEQTLRDVGYTQFEYRQGFDPEAKKTGRGHLIVIART